jgi:S-adenosyl-L-methionine hydrolase (adenosine-forming)
VLHPSGLITLLTDFGDRDWFVASMKGVILTINPQATIVDLNHQIPSHAIEEGAYVLKSCYGYFPVGTIHLAVVDPGVGGGRRPLMVKSSRYFFVAPDNGLLTYIFTQERDVEVREIENTQYRLESGGSTFDGRDLFAPAAAWLTRRQSFSSYGRECREYSTFPIAVPRWEQMALVGEVEYVDRFGNLITNLRTDHVKEVQKVTRRPNPSIRLREYLIDGLVGCYGEGDARRPCALLNSNGQVEIFLKESSASARLNVGRHESVKLS